MHSLRSALQLSLAVLFVSSSLTPIHGQDDLSSEPFVVYVAQEGAFARCGPSGEYYRTDPLDHGQALEVYAETDDGWLGIRPPDDSFCWIVAETVDADGSEENGTVIEDRTVAWIGTHLGRARKYRWQVQLAKGEPVSILGRSEREGPNGPQLWYRIVPPSGEFRWVHRDQVVSSSQELVASINREEANPDVEFLPGEESKPVAKKESLAANKNQDAASRRRSQDASRATSPRRPEQASLDSSPSAIGSGLKEDWRANGARGTLEDSSPQIEPVAAATLKDAVTRGGLLASVEFLGRPRMADIGAGSTAPSGLETAGDANWVAGMTRSNDRVSNNVIAQVAAEQPIRAGGNVQNAVARAMRTMNVVSAERVAAVEAETQGADVDRLSLILSRLMAARATAVETEPVVRAASRLANSSADQVTLGRARLLAERAEQYQGVASRRDGDVVIQSDVAPVIPAGQPQSSLSATGSYVQQAGVSPVGKSNAAVEQTGFLVQVYSARTNSPPFALTDHSGRTLAYVTPTPGVNIRMHLNSHIKVIGQQGFLRGLNTPHIMATQALRTPE